MTRQNTFTCFLIGNQTRLAQCGDVLLGKGHRILGVLSSDPMVRSWCQEKGLKYYRQDGNVIGALSQQPFDYLFSIDNFALLPREVLSIPMRLAINFHDGPLPRYAGSNSTNWALMAGERTHGVSWHVMTDKADAGDVLKQKLFPVAGDETAYTLNAKCLDASIRTFSELIDDLEKGTIDRRPQELAERTFCPLWKRPYAAATLDWGRPAGDLYNLWRGLEFGNYPNPLGLPKLFLGEQVVAVRKIALLAERSKGEPGTIVDVIDDTLHVAANPGVVSLSDFFTLEGERVSIGDLLASISLGKGERLPKLGQPLADKIDQTNAEISRYEGYWTERLSRLEPIEIPYVKRRRSAGEAIRPESTIFSLPLFDASRTDRGDTPGDIALYALILYLCRIGGKENFDVGYRGKSLQGLISGCEAYVSCRVPLRVEINLDQTWSAFHESLRKQIALAETHKTFVRDLKLRSPGLREMARHKVGAELPVTVYRVEALSGAMRPPAESDLAVFIPDSGTECLFVYDANVLDRDQVERMQDQFRTLLGAITGGYDRPIGDLPVIPEEERRKILEEWNSTFIDYPRDICLHELFEAQAARTPDAVALVFDDRSLSYREFNELANRLAHYLRRRGVGAESLVGVYMERSFEMVIGLYAIQKAGGAYVPLDPEYPKERIGFMLEDARTTVILTQAHLAADIPPSAATVICVDRDWPEISKESPENPQSGVKPENAAYVIFTSGSTGRPKGVLNEHRGIVNRLLWMQDEYGLTAKDAVLQKTTFSFDVSVWEFFWPLLVGSRLVVARPGGHRDSAYLVNTINEKDITTIHFVPSMLQLFLEDRNIGSCKGLKRVICSGEALPYELQERFFHSLDSELHNLYGPTEAAVDVTYWPCRRHSEVRSVPIGRPVANTQIYILDRRMRPVPVGVPGELHIGGIQVARGYVNRPDLTAEKFIPDPFSAEPGAHLYKTGDLCKFLPDGAIDYLGRLDFQVKIRGLRIEIGEIESVLSQHPDVREVVVVAREDTPGDKRLVAYFVSSKSSNVNIDDLRTFLKGKLADYMVPSAFLQMEAFPLTSSGKADRKALPAPAGMRQIETAFVAPQSEAENAIAEIWKEYLKLDAVGVHDNFFDLGGHSLLLVRIMNRLQQVFGRTMTVVDMFQHPTIQGLAEFVTADSQEAPEAGIIRDRAAKQKEALKRQKRLRRDSDCIQ